MQIFDEDFRRLRYNRRNTAIDERKKLEDVANPILASAYAAKDESANAGVPSEGATVEDDDDDLDIPDME